jgi:hypothetical protein
VLAFRAVVVVPQGPHVPLLQVGGMVQTQRSEIQTPLRCLLRAT